MSEGGKYHALHHHLRQSGQDELTLDFAEIEGLLNSPLPRSARTQRAWWSNRSRGAVQAEAWMQAGYHVVALDLTAEQVTFRKPGLVYNIQRQGEIVLWDADLVKALRHHMGLNQAELAAELGVRQSTISEWETGAYEPKRSSSKLLMLIAERAGFKYESG
ncbi:MAG: helix-turn-helix domain-containing protein [Anaerolineae bacterium]|nr:helix-turn-helix domain-containing protein [Anaerolineae bacterium]